MIRFDTLRDDVIRCDMLRDDESRYDVIGDDVRASLSPGQGGPGMLLNLR